VSDSSVNFRKEASTSSSRIRQLKQYAFCLVLGTANVDGTTWYRVNYGGQEGYVHGKYFKQMSMAELEEFLNSEEYLKGIANNSTTGDANQDFTTGGGIVSAEDQTVDQWTNPNNGLQVSYEPFDPFATVAPVETPVPTETVTIPVQPTATLEPIPTMDVVYPTGNDEQGGSGVLGWVIAVIVIALIGGGVYAYVTYTNNKRKAAQRAAARRAQAAAQQRNSEARPYARSTQANQPRTGTYPNQAAQRPMSNTAQQVRRPSVPVQGSYTRPVEPEQSQQADYTASYRNPATSEVRPVGRRSAYRAQQAQQNGYTSPYRSEAENSDFQQDKDNGDFE
ncbi:MAG: SH3 domain-containing protein, partial [Clostridia bacterium]|nr:SH3 domain-containing protein [Clostridia bacterium]